MATFIFTGYDVTDSGIEFDFHRTDPPPGGDTELALLVADAELSAVTTASQLRALVAAKLQRRVQASGIAAKLDPFIGQQVTI